jgi:hypothetical protein
LVEVAWADGQITPAEREGVLETARSVGLQQQSEFCRTTLARWLHERPPTEALEQWRQLLAPTLAGSDVRVARRSEDALLAAARRIAKMDERPFEEGASLDGSAGITADEQRVLDELAAALAAIARGD